MRDRSVEIDAVRKIIDKVISQKYLPGMQLVENQLAQELGISRTPVRNALRYLVANGFLEEVSKRGIVVPALNRHDVDCVFELRFLLEPQCAFLAAKRAVSAADKNKLYILIEKELSRKSNTSNQMDENINRDIHFNIIKLSGNNYYLKALTPVFWRCELYLFFFDSFYLRINASSNKRKSPYEHRQIVDAIFQNDPEKAKEFMDAHIRSTYEMLTSNAQFQ